MEGAAGIQSGSPPTAFRGGGGWFIGQLFKFASRDT